MEIKLDGKKILEEAMANVELEIGMTLKEAVEKQIPHKLAPKTNKGCAIPVCGKCGGIMDLMQGELNYCPNCGQRILWNEVSEWTTQRKC